MTMLHNLHLRGTMATVAIAVFMLLPGLGWGQTTFSWNFGTATGNAAPSSGSLSNLTVGNVSIGNTLGTVTMLSTTSASSGYTGASGQYNAGNAARIGAVNTGASGSAYFEFTLTPGTGYTVTLSAISFGSRSTGTAPQAYTLRSSSDSYVSDIATGTLLANSTWALKSNTGLSSASGTGTAITYRIYGYNGAGNPASGTINWRIDDLSIVVSITGGVNPSISAAPSSLNFGNVATGSTSAQQSYNVSGINLAGNITITAPTNCQVSTVSGGPYSGSVSVTQSGGTVLSTPIYVIFSPVTSGSYSDVVVNASSGATSVNVTVSGNGITYYYSASSGNLDQVGSWGTNSNGSGTNPPDFVSNYFHNFEIQSLDY